MFVPSAQIPRNVLVDIKHVTSTPKYKDALILSMQCTMACYLFAIHRSSQLPAHTIHSSTSFVDTNYEPEYLHQVRKVSEPPLSPVSQPDASDTQPRIPADAPLGTGAQMQRPTSTL